jgi:hypothetical protein
MKDPIVEEVRANRATLACECEKTGVRLSVFGVGRENAE